ncbi:CesT family type III secretion system chaperone [Succinimonas sp.]|uniref:CesT family type III secretion system chaperone n=1 Tax=Succinimonas sp. TaxID=1936151 RepID=UPI00386E4985
MNAFNKLLSEFSKLTGLDTEADSDNSCSMETDGGVIITIQYLENTNELAIFAPVTDPDKFAKLDYSVLKTALELSYNGEGIRGNNLGMFHDALILSKKYDAELVNAEKLADILINFSDTAVFVRNALVASIGIDSEESDFNSDFNSGSAAVFNSEALSV